MSAKKYEHPCTKIEDSGTFQKWRFWDNADTCSDTFVYFTDHSATLHFKYYLDNFLPTYIDWNIYIFRSPNLETMVEIEIVQNSELYCQKRIFLQCSCITTQFRRNVLM